ncbi:uncharacterized protein LOC113515886 [Galleria mellonella]|uniref:Regulatory protein zeste n=1 Tax=Galleria mellonella TaxID=7137 RepID=A0A6J1WMG7_GALME|nr:uncharacterized protein LOC113515886 [Galleria mellonella]
MTTTKGLALTKEEVSLLLDLIQANKVVTVKATSASSQQLKDAAWATITSSFNAAITSVPRKQEQLKLKWENLKKTARKRCAKIKMEQLKVGHSYISPDNALDRVVSMLDDTNVRSVPLGKNAENAPVKPKADSETISCVHDDDSASGSGEDIFENVICMSPSEFHQEIKSNSKQKTDFYNIPNGKEIKKQKLMTADIKARIARNNAIAEYYRLKTRKMELEVERLELENYRLSQIKTE